MPGVAMILGSFAIPPRGGLGLAIPGAILAMVGVVLWFQATNDLYATWAYAWALVAPTGVGLGMLLYGLAHRDGELARDGLRTTLVGIGLFLGFAFFFEGVLGLSGVEFPNVREAAPVRLDRVRRDPAVIAAFLTGREADASRVAAARLLGGPGHVDACQATKSASKRLVGRVLDAFPCLLGINTSARRPG